MSERRNNRAPRPPESGRVTGGARQAEPRRDSDAVPHEGDDVGVGDFYRTRPGNRWLFWEALDQETEQ
jgi:hypothetical protein